VVFGKGQYAPGTRAGNRLLAHELVHVMQQGGATTPPQESLEISTDSSAEREAESVALALEQPASAYAASRRPLEISRAESDTVPVEQPEGIRNREVMVAAAPKNSKLTLAQVKVLVDSNNNSSLTTELITCLIWKESGFEPKAKNKSSSATGLMQMTKTAVTEVNRNAPKGTHFEHSEMTDSAKNISCGTYYLKILLKRNQNNCTAALNKFGTGAGYSDDIEECETCMLGKAEDKQEPCLTAIHG
jgi:soluble lytic murein transglycosylase-like protein